MKCWFAVLFFLSERPEKLFNFQHRHIQISLPYLSSLRQALIPIPSALVPSEAMGGEGSFLPCLAAEDNRDEKR